MKVLRRGHLAYLVLYLLLGWQLWLLWSVFLRRILFVVLIVGILSSCTQAANLDSTSSKEGLVAGEETAGPTSSPTTADPESADTTPL